MNAKVVHPIVAAVFLLTVMLAWFTWTLASAVIRARIDNAVLSLAVDGSSPVAADRGLLVAGALEDGEAGVLGEAGIRLGPAAEPELGALGGDEVPAPGTVSAEPGRWRAIYGWRHQDAISRERQGRGTP